MLEGVLLCWNIIRCMRMNLDVQKYIWIYLYLCRWMGVEYCSGVDVCFYVFIFQFRVLSRFLSCDILKVRNILCLDEGFEYYFN